MQTAKHGPLWSGLVVRQEFAASSCYQLWDILTTACPCLKLTDSATLPKWQPPVAGRRRSGFPSSSSRDTQITPNPIKQEVAVLDLLIDSQFPPFIIASAFCGVKDLDNRIETCPEKERSGDAFPGQGMDDSVPCRRVQTARPDGPHPTDVDDNTAGRRVGRDPVRVGRERDRLGGSGFRKKRVRQNLKRSRRLVCMQESAP